jgi:acyl-coenzyme A thioesterase 13
MDTSHISGSAPDNVKQALGNPADFFVRRPSEDSGPIFGESIVKRMVVTEISIDKKVEEPRKLEGRFVCELTVEDGTLLGFATCLQSHSVS